MSSSLVAFRPICPSDLDCGSFRLCFLCVASFIDDPLRHMCASMHGLRVSTSLRLHGQRIACSEVRCVFFLFGHRPTQVLLYVFADLCILEQSVMLHSFCEGKVALLGFCMNQCASLLETLKFNSNIRVL